MDKLVRRAQKGHDAAFLTLFQQYEAYIYRMAYVYVQNENDALDIVQETAYRAFKSIRSLKEPAYFKTWLLKITINSALDLLRKRQVTVAFEDAEIEESYKDQLLLEISLRDLMARLDEAEKTVVLLKYYEDMTFQEIAKLLDIPLGSVKTTLYRALKKLRKWEGNDLHG